MYEAAVNSCYSHTHRAPQSRGPTACVSLVQCIQAGRVNTKRSAPNRSSDGGHVAYQVFQHTTSLLAEPQVPHNVTPGPDLKAERAGPEQTKSNVACSNVAELEAFSPSSLHR